MKGLDGMTSSDDILNKLRRMDDDTLRMAIGAIADAVGANEKQRARVLGNVNSIKRKLDNANQRDIDKAVERLGSEKADDIKRILGL